jgi:hypothetical protein
MSPLWEAEEGRIIPLSRRTPGEEKFHTFLNILCSVLILRRYWTSPCSKREIQLRRMRCDNAFHNLEIVCSITNWKSDRWNLQYLYLARGILLFLKRTISSPNRRQVLLKGHRLFIMRWLLACGAEMRTRLIIIISYSLFSKIPQQKACILLLLAFCLDRPLLLSLRQMYVTIFYLGPSVMTANSVVVFVNETLVFI